MRPAHSVPAESLTTFLSCYQFPFCQAHAQLAMLLVVHCVQAGFCLMLFRSGILRCLCDPGGNRIVSQLGHPLPYLIFICSALAVYSVLSFLVMGISLSSFISPFHMTLDLHLLNFQFFVVQSVNHIVGSNPSFRWGFKIHSGRSVPKAIHMWLSSTTGFLKAFVTNVPNEAFVLTSYRRYKDYWWISLGWNSDLFRPSNRCMFVLLTYRRFMRQHDVSLASLSAPNITNGAKCSGIILRPMEDIPGIQFLYTLFRVRHLVPGFWRIGTDFQFADHSLVSRVELQSKY